MNNCNTDSEHTQRKPYLFLVSLTFLFLLNTFFVLFVVDSIVYKLINTFNDSFLTIEYRSWFQFVPFDFILEAEEFIYNNYYVGIFGFCFLLSIIYEAYKEYRSLEIINSKKQILFSYVFTTSLLMLSTSLLVSVYFTFSSFISENHVFMSNERTQHTLVPPQNTESIQTGIIFGIDFGLKTDISDFYNKLRSGMIKNVFITHVAAMRVRDRGEQTWNEFVTMLKDAKKEYGIKIYVDLEKYFFNQIGFEFPPQAVQTMSYTPEEIYMLSLEYGKILREKLQVDFVLGPVLDRKISPMDSLLGSRSYSNNYEKIYVYASALIAGFHDAGIVCVAKHFPGHPQIELLPNNSHKKALSFYSDNEIENSSKLFGMLYDKNQIQLRSILLDPVVIPSINAEYPFTVVENGVSQFLSKENIYGKERLKNSLVISDAVTMVMGKYDNDDEENIRSNDDPFIASMCKSTIDLFNAGHDMVLTQDINIKYLNNFLDCIEKNSANLKSKTNAGNYKATAILNQIRSEQPQKNIYESTKDLKLQKGYTIRLSNKKKNSLHGKSTSNQPKKIFIISTCYKNDDISQSIKKIFNNSQIDTAIFNRSLKKIELEINKKKIQKKFSSKDRILETLEEYKISLLDYETIFISFDKYEMYNLYIKPFVEDVKNKYIINTNISSMLKNNLIFIAATHPEFYYDPPTRESFLNLLMDYPVYSVFRNSQNADNSLKQVVCDLSESSQSWDFCTDSPVASIENYEINLPDYYYVNRMSHIPVFYPDQQHPLAHKRFLGLYAIQDIHRLIDQLESKKQQLYFLFIAFLAYYIALFFLNKHLLNTRRST